MKINVVNKKHIIKINHKSPSKKIYNNQINSIKNIGQNKTLIILATGPSISEINTKQLLDYKIDTMSINEPNENCWPTNYWVFCDKSQFEKNKKYFDNYKKTIINTMSIKNMKQNQININILNNIGFSTDLTKGAYIGRSSTYFAMQIANWINYDHIIILGIDMCKINGKMHTFKTKPGIPDNIRETRFEKEALSYQYAADNLPNEIKSKFYFCSDYNPWPFMEKFNKIKQKDLFDVICHLCGNHKVYQ